MPIDPFTGMAIAQGVGSGLQWLLGRSKRRRFDETPYGQRLRKLMEEGMPTEVRSNIIGGVASRVGGIAQKAKAGYRGRLESLGMGGSIAGQRGLLEPEMKAMGQVADVTQDVETQSTMIKEQAKGEYAKAKTGYEAESKEAGRQSDIQAIGGIAGAAGTYFGGKIQQQRLETQIAPRKSYYDLLTAKIKGQPEQISQNLEQFKTSYGQWDQVKILNYARQLSPQQAIEFKDYLTDLGVIIDWEGL